MNRLLFACGALCLLSLPLAAEEKEAKKLIVSE